MQPDLRADAAGAKQIACTAVSTLCPVRTPMLRPWLMGKAPAPLQTPLKFEPMVPQLLPYPCFFSMLLLGRIRPGICKKLRSLLIKHCKTVHCWADRRLIHYPCVAAWAAVSFHPHCPTKPAKMPRPLHDLGNVML